MGIQEVQEDSSCPVNNVLCCILAAFVYKRYLARQECGTDFLRGAGPLRLVLGLPAWTVCLNPADWFYNLD